MHKSRNTQRDEIKCRTKSDGEERVIRTIVHRKIKHESKMI